MFFPHQIPIEIPVFVFMIPVEGKTTYVLEKHIFQYGKKIQSSPVVHIIQSLGSNLWAPSCRDIFRNQWHDHHETLIQQYRNAVFSNPMKIQTTAVELWMEAPYPDKLGPENPIESYHLSIQNHFFHRDLFEPLK